MNYRILYPALAAAVKTSTGIDGVIPKYQVGDILEFSHFETGKVESVKTISRVFCVSIHLTDGKAWVEYEFESGNVVNEKKVVRQFHENSEVYLDRSASDELCDEMPTEVQSLYEKMRANDPVARFQYPVNDPERNECGAV